jgi:LmbE family N-acetylglucosaminyl deacetylase
MASGSIEQNDTYIRIIWRWLTSLLKRGGNSKKIQTSYAVVSVCILLATTVVWAILGARIQLNNADQLSDSYLFSSLATFRGAYFPGAHTLLLKWPVFWLINVFGLTSTNLDIVTVAIVMCTVVPLVFVLYKINRRPLIFGTICLAMSLALLLVPTQPYAGGLLPVGMAMITTRNIEYIVYIAALTLFARSRHLKDLGFVAGVLLLALLIASDKLFLSLSLGGAILALIAYSSIRAWSFVQFALRWILGSTIAAALASAILTLISALRITHLVNSASASPYSLDPGTHKVALGVIYSVLGFLSNTGANPVYDNLILRQLPSSLTHRLVSMSGLAYTIAAIATVYALVLAWRVLWRDPRLQKRQKASAAHLLALGLLWSTVVAFGAFVFTNHDYAVDARYLTIGFFALVVAASVALRGKIISRPDRVLGVACCLVVAIALAVGTSVRISDNQEKAFSSLANRNESIATTLKQHNVSLLVGSYWRVLPIKLAMQGSLNVMPLQSCTVPDSALTSSVWQPNLRQTSFAYLLTLGPTIAAFPNCSVQQVVNAYGRPNSVQVVSGTLAKPTEVVLFYDQGSHPSKAVRTAYSSATQSILPISLSDLTNAQCAGSTVMNVVAHQDDDLLFLSPDLANEIHDGDCIRTIFLTAGNDGQGKPYWLSRQLGSEAAYNEMLGSNSTWVQKTVEVATNEYVTVANPQGNQKVSLVFFNLPDGNLQGQGFPISHFESLAKLRSGAISSIQTVDGQSSYSSTELIAALVKFMQLYSPTEIHTQADKISTVYPDHSDHIATGQFTETAATTYDQQEFNNSTATPVKFYVGYPIHGYPANVTGTELAEKEAAFFAYARYDFGVCRTLVACQNTTYKFYLSREYQAQP